MANTTKPAIAVKEITASSSLTINLGNYNSGKLEFSMTKTINKPEQIDLEAEKEALWNEVNSEVDRQAQELKNVFNKK